MTNVGGNPNDNDKEEEGADAPTVEDNKPQTTTEAGETGDDGEEQDDGSDEDND